MLMKKTILLLAIAAGLICFPNEAFSSDIKFISHDINANAWYDYINDGAYPYSKLVFGPAGTGTIVSSSNPLPAACTQVTNPWVTSRTWTLSSSTDSVTAVGNVASGSADSGNPVKVGAKYNATMPSFSDGQRANLQVNQFGELACRSRNKYLNMVGNVTTTVKSGAGVLHTICFNGGANSTTATLYDNTTATGTKIGTLDLLSVNSNVLSCLNYDVEFTIGLTIVLAGSNNNDITVTYQ